MCVANEKVLKASQKISILMLLTVVKIPADINNGCFFFVCMCVCRKNFCTRQKGNVERLCNICANLLRFSVVLCKTEKNENEHALMLSMFVKNMLSLLPFDLSLVVVPQTRVAPQNY